MKRNCLGLRVFFAAAAFILGPFVAPGAPSAGGLQFDGVDDYVTFGQASSLGGYTFTLEAWFKRTGVGVTASSGSGGVTAVPLVSKGRGEGDGSNVDMNYFLGIRTTDNVLVADFEDAATGLNHPVAGRTAIAMNTWYHAAVTFDRTTTTWRLYLDGVLETQLNVGQIPRGDSIQHASLGSALTSTGLPAGYFAGVLDDVRIWNYARTEAEILANKDTSISSATGLVGSWLLNERTGLTATDNSVSRVDGSLINGPVWVNAPAPLPPVTLVPTGAVWKYHDQGLDLGTSWREPNFDDCSWSSGPAELGFGDYPVTTVSYGPNSKAKYTTTYFRHTFTAENAAAFTNLVLRLLRDDGAVVYLNGTEVARQNMPGGPITYSTFASSAVGSTDETTYFPATIDPAYLVEGNNLLAVEIHQNVGNSTDLSFDLELTGQIPTMTLTLQAPAPDALNVLRPPALSANVWHRSGNPMTATIYGRVAPPLAGPNFTIAVLPDTQNYTAGVNGGNLAMLQAQIDFIITNRESSNIVYVAQLGDVSNDGDNYLTQWQNAMTAYYSLGNSLPGFPEGIPFGLAVGNHDQMVPSGDTEPTTYYNQYFGIDYYAPKTSYYGGHYGNNNNNQYHLFSASGLDFIVIFLEYAASSPDAAVLAWANNLLQTYPNRRGIVVSHNFLNVGTPATFSPPGSATYDALKANPNFFMMLCGHNTGECQRQDIYNNNTVRSFMTDFQGRTNGGSGFMRLMEFNPRQNKVLAWTLSPYFGGFEHDADSQFEFYYNMESGAQPFVPLATFENVGSGETISATWPGLNTSSTYEWYVSLNDGTEIITSERRHFTTENNAAPVLTLNGASTITLECHTSFADTGATATDPEDGSLPVTVTGTVDETTPGLYTLTYTAIDTAGASASVTRTVNIVDTTPPVLTILGDNPAFVQCGSTYSDAGATALDACAGDLTSAIGSVTTVNLGVLGTHTVTYTVSDPFGNTASTTRTVQVIDSSNPVLALNGLASMTVECGSPFADPGASALDTCAGILPVTVSGSVNTAVLGEHTLTYTAADASGNTGSATRTVHVVDSTPPVIVLKEGPSTVECHSTFPDPGATATDSCAGSVTVIASGAVDANIPGAYTLTYIATDPSGNTATATRTVTVRDSTPPVLTLNGLADVTIECHSSFTDEGASAADSCAGAVPVTTTGSVDPNTLGTYILSYNAADAAGNSSTATRTVRVVDTAAPTIALVGPIPLVLECHTTFTDPGATATDLCAGDLTPTVSGDLDANTPGSYTLTYTATDPSGNFASATRTVQVVDTTKPTISLAGASTMTVECHTSFTDLGATASDACAGALQVTTTGSVDANTPGSYTLTYTATDPSGNTATATRIVTVEDTTAPTLTLNGSAQITIEEGTPFVDPGATATDACAGDLTAIPTGFVDVSIPGTYPITYTAIDASENTGTVTRTVIVLAAAPPSITTSPQSSTAACGESVRFTVSATGLGQLIYQWKKGTENLVDAGNISGATSATLTINPVSLADAGDYSVVVANQYGNTPSATATLTIVDAPPAITLNGATEVTIECHTTFTDPWVTTLDACSADVTVAVTGSVDPNAVGDYPLTYTATDSAEQTASVTRTVHVVDTTAPVVTLNGELIMTVECHTTFSDPGATALDACAGTRDVTTSGTVNVDLPGTYTITYTAADPSGNTATATRTILVQDTTPPAVGRPADRNALADANCQAPVPDVLTGLTATDNCDAEVTVVQNPTAGTLVSLGVTSITITATDEVGNDASCTVSFTVTDRTPPVVALNGSSPMQVEFGSSFTDPGATATDICAGTLPVTVTGLPVNVNSLGSQTLTYTATDPSDNSASITRMVNIVDTTAPAVTLNGELTMTVECHGTFSDLGATALDACAGTRNVTTSGTVNVDVPGTYTITYTAADPSGNIASATRTVIVQDTTAPVLTLNGLAELTLDCQVPFVDDGATALDLCAGNLNVTVAGSVNTSAPGTYLLTYSVSDPAGNAATPVTRVVHVVDTLPPVITLTGDATITVECHTAFTDPGATATDNCAGNFAATASGTVDVNTPGSYTLTYNAADPSGNSALAVTRTVQVVDTTAPVITLNGPAAIQLELGTSYTEQGATAADACAGNLAVAITGTVDINTPADYTVTYTATDAANNRGTATRVVTVLVDSTPPEITAVAAVDITTTTARITWTTDEPSDSTVDYGLDLTYGTVVADPTLATAHTIDLANLTPGTTYYYSVASCDAVGNSTVLYANTFTTASAVNYDAYVIQDPTLTAGGLGPEGFAATLEQDGIGQTITEVSAVARLAAVYTLRTPATPPQITALTLNLTATWTALEPTDSLVVSIWNGTVWVDITSEIQDGSVTLANPQAYVDADGNILVQFTDSEARKGEAKDTVAIDLLYAQVLAGPPDTQAPAAPAGLALSAVDNLNVTLAWAPNAEGDLAGYRVYRSTGADYQLITPQLVSAPTHTDTTPAAGTYSYVVTAVDRTGNESSASAPIEATTSQPTCSVHLDSITMSIQQASLNYQARAAVLVVDQTLALQPGATVTGDWYFKGSISQAGVTAQTDASGVAVLTSPSQRRPKSGDTFTFRVTNVVLPSCAYDSTQNVVSESSIAVP